MECPKCDAPIKDDEKKCPYCEYDLTKEKKKTDKKKGIKQSSTAGIIASLFLLIIVGIIFIPNISRTLDEQSKINNEQELTSRLISQGKTVSAEQILNEIIDCLTRRDETQIKMYVSDDFTYTDNSNYTSKHIENLWKDLKYLVTNYSIEHRGNSIENQETYYIYWNTNEKVTDKTDRLYCLQKINIKLTKVVEQEQITYKIKQIILTNN